MDKARVFFTKELTPEAVVKLYKRLGVELRARWQSRCIRARTAIRIICARNSCAR